jgi:NAD(P)-dependent dehydrogenase (short-subunit alcohol dehydrogenase family)
MRSVLITGTSTGIGRATAVSLAGEGWRVYAGVRKDEDARAVEAAAPGDVVAVKLDVTDADSIAAAVARIEADTGGRLDGLVNNAGVYLGGPLEFMTRQEIERTYAVNVIGLLEVTRAFLPMLRAARGRIVNVSSISGLVALPGVSVYAGSKHAVEAITDSLRVELAGFGIHVSSVEPGSVRTAIWEKGAARDQARAAEPGTAETRKLYAPLVRLLEKLNSRPGVLPPEQVAEAIADALESEKPRNRYLCGNDAKSLSLLGKLPDALRDRLIGSKIR